ncbi:GntR family transcriptional regulator [Piscinibacter sakaiensis]|uniref:Transcriptional regulator, GntR family n=1 Tax=Piscinibacter sakaiensis TaxID=1547922 RepID=A0A0K8NZZ9_PISS1|nr:GntR family transcriptional regulator [Piscinibacter sakaiensis]GAP35953.1 transcriptional regulator, GntR family [Piscinibacter sakaiensis]
MPDPAPPLVDQAFQRLRHDVLTGRHAPGSKLKVDELQDTYGCSSSPLREALSRLSQEGLVRADERRGFRVAAMSAEDLRDITRLRLTLDLPALDEAIRAGDDAWEAGIVAAFHRLEKVESRLSDGPLILDDGWSALHRDFHAAMLAACASMRLKAWSASLFDQAERYRRFAARHRTQARRKSADHRRLMDATLQRDAATACALLGEHIRGTLRQVEAAFAATGRSER